MALVAKIPELVRRAFSRILRYPKHVLVPALVVLLIGVVGLATLPLRAAAGFQGSKTTPTPTVSPTPTPLSPWADLRITSNQDMQVLCGTAPQPYTITLLNEGNVPVTWTGLFNFGALGPTGFSRLTPLSGVQWATSNPASDTVAPGETGSLEVTPTSAIACPGGTARGSLTLTFPAGGAQPDIQLTYSGVTALPTPTPKPSGKPVKPAPNLVVTANQNAQLGCLVAQPSYTISLANTGNVPVAWNVMFPFFGVTPWGNPTPGSGTLAPGQTTTVTMQVQSDPPCNGAPNIATLQLSFPQGGSEHDIQLTYAEAGTPPDSTVELSGNVNFVDSCASGVPSSYTFAVHNVGNVRAYPSFIAVESGSPVGAYGWATVSGQPAGTTWIEPGQEITYTVMPNGITETGGAIYSGVTCDGSTYHLTLQVTGYRTTTQTFTLTDAIALNPAKVVVTQNQPFHDNCASSATSYPVTLSNTGSQTATWTVAVDPSGPSWGTFKPTTGTIKSGKTATFTVNTPVPSVCGPIYHAFVHVTYADGTTQSDIVLTYYTF